MSVSPGAESTKCGFFSREITRALNKRAWSRVVSAILSLSDVLLRVAGLPFLHYLPEASVIKKKIAKKIPLRGVTFMAPAFLPVLHSECRSGSGCVNEAGWPPPAQLGRVAEPGAAGWHVSGTL